MFTDDDVLFQTDQVVHLTFDRSFCQDFCCLLEGCCRQEGFCSQRCFGNTEHDLLACCRLFSFCFHLLVHFVELQNIYHSSRQEFGISSFLDTNLLQHLAYNNLDMLVIDFYTLQTVNSLYFLDHVILYGTKSFDLQDIVRIYTTFCQLISGLQIYTILNLDTGTVWDQVCFGFSCLIICYNDLTLFLCIADCCRTGKLCDNRKSFRLSCLKKLFDTRKTLCDIVTGNSTRMECTHGQLCTRFTDGLSSNDTDCFTNLNGFPCCHVCTVTFCTNTILTFTCKDCTDLHCIQWFTVFVNRFFHDSFCTLRCDHVICFDDDISILVFQIFTRESSCDTLLQTFDFFISVHECFYIHSRNLFSFCRTITVVNDKLLRNINQTSCQVS